MNDKDKTKEQLIKDLEALRARNEALESVEARLNECEDRYRALVESTDDSIYVVDRGLKYLFMNKKHQERIGLKKGEYINQPYGTYHSLEETKRFIDCVEQIFKDPRPCQKEHYSERDGTYFLRTLSPIMGEDGSVQAVSVVSKNITELKKMEANLRELSLTDDLTGLYNRRGFYMLADQQLKMSNRIGTGICLLYADVDDLKTVNDTYGHKEGDRLLQDAAALLKENFRDSDIIARIGGDEFVIVPIHKSERNIEALSTRFHGLLNEFNRNANRVYHLSISFGIAAYEPKNPLSLDELLHEADMAMYKVKMARKGKTH